MRVHILGPIWNGKRERTGRGGWIVGTEGDHLLVRPDGAVGNAQMLFEPCQLEAADEKARHELAIASAAARLRRVAKEESSNVSLEEIVSSMQRLGLIE